MNTAYAAGATSKIVKVRGITISTGLPYTAGAHNTSGLTVQYIRDGGTVQTITQVTATAGTYTSSGFVHAGGGVYEIGAPTAALASGADGVVFVVSGVSDVLFSVTRVELMGGDPRASTVVLEDGSLTNAKFADNAIDADVLASNTIANAKIADNAITAAKIASDAITAAKIATDAITAAKIAADAIGASELATDAVTEIVTAIFARAYNAKMSSLTFEELTALMATTLLGKASGMGTTSAAIRNLADNADAVTATVDADGNRTAVTLTAASVR